MVYDIAGNQELVSRVETFFFGDSVESEGDEESEIDEQGIPADVSKSGSKSEQAGQLQSTSEASGLVAGFALLSGLLVTMVL